MAASISRVDKRRAYISVASRSSICESPLSHSNRLERKGLWASRTLGQIHLQAPLGGVWMPRLIPDAVAPYLHQAGCAGGRQHPLLGLQAILDLQGGPQRQDLAEGSCSVLGRPRVLK